MAAVARRAALERDQDRRRLGPRRRDETPLLARMKKFLGFGGYSG